MGRSCSRLSAVVFVCIRARTHTILTTVYTLIGASINGASWFRVFAGLVIFIIGLVYIVLEAVPSVSPPENMSPEGISIGVQDEDIV